MFSFIKQLFNKDNSNENNDKNTNAKNIGEQYENKLFEEYGMAKEYNPYGINILFITDTHNCLAYTDKYLEELKSYKPTDYDICIILGDISGLDIDAIKSVVPPEKLYGIVGNHDSINLMEENNIANINGRVIECKGIRIAAIMGSNRYKNGDYGMMTQEESIELAEQLGEADILVSHDKAYIYDRHDNVHDGLKGITYYIYKNHVPIHIHGHLHDEFDETLKNNTLSKCLYRIKLLKL